MDFRRKEEAEAASRQLGAFRGWWLATRLRGTGEPVRSSKSFSAMKRLEFCLFIPSAHEPKPRFGRILNASMVGDL
jgi:hypothetical protein